MRVAVCGVGLIGGSIGLAAQRRLDAEVIGYDPEPRALERGVELGVLSRGAGSVAEAVADAELVFCAAPVGFLPALVAQALEASGDDTVVSDVGSTKRDLVEGLAAHPEAGRFIGGHPIAGAETAGVENARAELFDGARWYLTPGGQAGGVHYDRLQRAVAELGARPQAIDPELHDRLMATVSHLPHVIANVMVSQAETALSDEADRLPEVGRSFRDTTRVAGANPTIWKDIFTSNSEAVAAEIDRTVERLREAAELIRAGDVAAVEAWQARARNSRSRLLETGAGGGALQELQVTVPNKPGVVAEIALALGRAGVNIEDMALQPAADMRTGAISLWVAGDEDAARAVAVMRELGHAASAAGSSA
ncbi:MAG: prephenate dehydrogenase/arogenate dehydrogenase family protein [Actinomycetota bacterium]|nr:prephenate dehydrogenase/arogenate dehydrogenase family protein [Actinomycetota bacterium]